VRYEHPPIASLLIGAVQEADLVSPGFKQSKAISQIAQPWTSLCITVSNGSSFLAMHRGNGYALRVCHQIMMNVHGSGQLISRSSVQSE